MFGVKGASWSMLTDEGLCLVMTNSVLIAIDKKSKTCFHRIYLFSVWILLSQYLAVVMRIDGYAVT